VHDLRAELRLDAIEVASSQGLTHGLAMQEAAAVAEVLSLDVPAADIIAARGLLPEGMMEARSNVGHVYEARTRRS